MTVLEDRQEGRRRDAPGASRGHLCRDPDLMERLPAFYRERPGDLAALAEAVAASARRLRSGLARAAAALEPGGERPPPAGGCTGGLTHAALRRAVERLAGAPVLLWPAVRLECAGGEEGGGEGIDEHIDREIDERSGPRLRVMPDAGRCLAVVLPRSALRGSGRRDLSPGSIREALGPVLSAARGLFPPGVDLQIAIVEPPVPANPRVRGLLLNGGLLAWD